MEKVLKEFWGYDNFRGLQKEIIESVMSNQATIALLPTGGGKSVCFQLPGLILDGLCLVISPLVALMKDQVDGLKAKGILAEAIYAGMHKNEIDIILDNCIYGETKFLYCSPERLSSDLFLERVKKFKIGLIAIDEAHCISQWGEDFRPAYLKINSFIESLAKKPKIIALTASATKKVQDEIIEKLGLKDVKTFRQSFLRENLVYAVRKTQDKEKKMREIFERIAGSGIVYVRNRRKTKEVSDFLNENGIIATYYHGGLEQKERNEKQEKWMKDQIRVMVATNAFGMGIDKPNVKIVVHLDLNDCFEDYYQEAGRAGRDQKKSVATIVYNEQDVEENIENIKSQNPDIELIKQVYQSLANYYQLAIGSGEHESFEFVLSDFSQKYQLKVKRTYAVLKAIEKLGLIELSEAIHSPSKIKIELDNRDLYKFQIENEKYDKLLKLMLRSTGGQVFTNFVKIDEFDLAKKYMTPVQEVRKMLSSLNQQGIVSYQPSSREPKITFLTGRKDVKDLGIYKKYLEDRKNKLVERFEAFLNYVTQNIICRQQLILEYFDEQDIKPCGICDVCLEKKKKGSDELGKDEEELTQILKNKIAKHPQISVKELVAKFNWKQEKEILHALKTLVEIGLVKYDAMGRLDLQ